MPRTQGSERSPRRADARRNIEAILGAARQCLSRDPDASVGDIATAAGVGRVTLYGHFGSRAELVDATVTEALNAFDTDLEAVDLTGDPSEALVRLVNATWQRTAESALLVVAAERALPPDRLLAAHQRPMKRIAEFFEHGQAQQAFRSDLPASWLVSVFHSIVHAAANEISAGRMDSRDAGEAIATTLLAAVQAPTGGSSK
jgi:TetR/AcrR family transcriptional regulator, mexCD-oprJ operon repressor